VGAILLNLIIGALMDVSWRRYEGTIAILIWVCFVLAVVGLEQLHRAPVHIGGSF
jgi:hypothetical protein